MKHWILPYLFSWQLAGKGSSKNTSGQHKMYSGYARMENTILIPKSHEESKKYHYHTTITRRPN